MSSGLLHALSVDKSADFPHLNRLYRERDRLSARALVYAALAHSNSDRDPIAQELLHLLEEKVTVQKQGGETVAFWAGDTGTRETTALAVLAMCRLQPKSPLLKQAATHLLQEGACYDFTPSPPSARGRPCGIG